MPILRFILGRSGTGKTHRGLEQMRARLRENPFGPPLILLAPEQATFQLEQALVKTPGLEGYFRAHVLSFRRLAYRVFDELGGRAIPPAGNLKRLLILKSILTRRQRDLLHFGPSARTVGFAQALDATLVEWRRYGLSPEAALERFEQWRGETGPRSALARKLHDLALVEQEYRAAIRNRFIEPEDFLDRLATLAGQSRLLAGAEIWIDGFADFTTLERRALIAVLRAVDAAEIALCLDPKNLGEGLPANTASIRPFAACEKTYWRVRREAIEAGIDLAHDLALESPQRFQSAPALAAIERHFLSRALPRKISAAPSVRVLRAPSLQAEIDTVALEALRLACEENIPYREMAVITRELETCHDLLRAAMSRRGIPFFMDRQREIAHHPLAQLLHAAGDILAHNWRTPDVFQALKSGLLPVEPDDADRIENYAIEHGIGGETWRAVENWDEAIAPLWAQALAPLNDLQTACGASGRLAAASYAGAMRALIDTPVVNERLAQWAAECREAGDLEAAAEHEQALEAIRNLLEEWAGGLGDEPMALRECADLLAEGLDALRLRLSPPALDHLLIGSIERSRHPNVRVAFLLGMNEGVFPQRPGEDLLLTDEDRAALSSEGIELAPGARDRLLHEPYLAYIALTRPSERLIVTHSHSDEKCRPLAPSPYLERIGEILDFDSCAAEAPEDSLASIADLASLGEHVTRALSECRQQAAEPPPSWIALAELGYRLDDAPRTFARRLDGLFYANRSQLSPGQAHRLYRERIASGLGATHFERFGECPFRFFAQHGLRLKARQAFAVGVLDRGELMHEALAALFHRLQERGLNWGQADWSELRQWAEDVLNERAAIVRGGALRHSARGRFQLDILQQRLRERVRILAEESRASAFQQIEAEAVFGGDENTAWPALEMPLEDGSVLRLKGKIDRIDQCATANGRALRILDYKTGGRDFNPQLIEEGIQLQLPLYLLAVTRHSRAIPAGFFYSPVFPKLGKANYRGAEDSDHSTDAFLDAFKGRGIFDADFAREMDTTIEDARKSNFWAIRLKNDGTLYADSDGAPGECIAALLAAAEYAVHGFAEAMLEGECAVLPYRLHSVMPCAYCDFADVCRFDPSLQNARSISPLKRAEALEKIMAEFNSREEMP